MKQATTRAKVTGLAYIGLSSPAVDIWGELFESIVGGSPEVSASKTRIRIDDWAHRIEIAPGEQERLDYLGWQVEDRAGLDALVARLADANHDAELIEGDAALASRGVGAFARLKDPDGNIIELACEPQRTGKPAESPWGCSFVTGDQGLGHVFFVSSNYAEMLNFYALLGFGESDRFANGAVMFLHCNPREHSLALADASAGLGFAPGFNHFMLEVDDETAVGQAHDRCVAEHRPLAYSLGKHTNDLMFSFYMRTPGPWDLELGFGGRRIDPTTWTMTELESESLWGHRPVGEASP